MSHLLWTDRRTVSDLVDAQRPSNRTKICQHWNELVRSPYSTKTSMKGLPLTCRKPMTLRQCSSPFGSWSGRQQNVWLPLVSQCNRTFWQPQGCFEDPNRFLDETQMQTTKHNLIVEFRWGKNEIILAVESNMWENTYRANFYTQLGTLTSWHSYSGQCRWRPSPEIKEKLFDSFSWYVQSKWDIFSIDFKWINCCSINSLLHTQ